MVFAIIDLIIINVFPSIVVIILMYVVIKINFIIRSRKEVEK